MTLSRRRFLHDSLLTSAAALAATTTGPLRADEAAQSSSPNERLNVAIIGVKRQGGSHLKYFSRRKDTRVTYICDADEKIGRGRIAEVADQQGFEPKFVQDMRRVFDDPEVDLISTATPNHWHALLSIWAMEAGKDVYVEKPCSHNVWEGRQMVNAARKLGRICQIGTQCRSSSSLRDAVRFVSEGELGKIEYVIGTCFRHRGPIGKRKSPLVIPPQVDYDLWCGPAEKRDLYRNSMHYDWHWDFNTGNGDLGNQGIHQMDIARWFLGEAALSPRVMSFGGRLGWDDAGDTPNAQLVYHDYDRAPLLFDVRNHKSDAFRGSSVGVVVQCERGAVVVPSYTSATAFDLDGERIKTWNGGGDHFGNFVTAARSGKHTDLHADILEGHLSSALCHTGNISYQLGKRMAPDEIRASFAAQPLAVAAFDRLAAHLEKHKIDLDQERLTLGSWLEMDPRSERFTNSEHANALLTRQYREPFVVPEYKG